MINQNKPKPVQPAYKSEAQPSASPARNAGDAPTTGAAKIGNLRRAVLRERVRVHLDVINTSLDALMDQPDLCLRIRKQMLISWLMLQHSSLPYHDSECAAISETLLDVILELLGSHIRDEAEGKKDGAPGGGGGDGGEADETTVLPQPSGPESPTSAAVAVDVPKPKGPPEKSPRRKINPDFDQDMGR